MPFFLIFFSQITEVLGLCLVFDRIMITILQLTVFEKHKYHIESAESNCSCLSKRMAGKYDVDPENQVGPNQGNYVILSFKVYFNQIIANQYAEDASCSNNVCCVCYVNLTDGFSKSSRATKAGIIC